MDDDEDISWFDHSTLSDAEFDTNQSNHQMTKDTSSTSQKGQSSQYTNSGPPNIEKASTEEEVIN